MPKCNIKGCERNAIRKGLCSSHYSLTRGICSVEDCNKAVIARGLCPKHYAKLQKWGDPLAVKVEQLHGLSLKERLYAHLEQRGKCLEWTGYKDPNGYGRLNINNTPVPVHRISYEIHIGPIPEGMSVLHHCDNPPCCLPEHLFIGTRADNVKDCISKGRARRGISLGEAHGCSVLTEKQVLEIRVSKEKGVVLARQYRVSCTTISDIRNRKIWTHV